MQQCARWQSSFNLKLLACITPKNRKRWKCRGWEWNEPLNSCKGQTQPYLGVKYPGGIPLASVVINKVLSRIKKPVYLLDITTLSQYRKDAHPSYYGRQNAMDCSHWCLPGLPDTWNLLLYTMLFHWINAIGISMAERKTHIVWSYISKLY